MSVHLVMMNLSTCSFGTKDMVHGEVLDQIVGSDLVYGEYLRQVLVTFEPMAVVMEMMKYWRLWS